MRGLAYALWSATLATLVCCQLEHSDRGVGPFTFVIHRFAQCEERKEEPKIFFHSTRMNKVNRVKFLFSSNITFLVPFSDDLEGTLDFALLGNGGWKPHHLTFETTDVCTGTKKYFPGVFNTMLEIAHVKTCPLPPVRHHMTQVWQKIILPIVVIGQLIFSCCRENEEYYMGTFEIVKFDLSTVKVTNMPQFPYGVYRVDYVISNKGEFMGCIRVFFDVLPKRKSKPKK